MNRLFALLFSFFMSAATANAGFCNAYLSSSNSPIQALSRFILFGEKPEVLSQADEKLAETFVPDQSEQVSVSDNVIVSYDKSKMRQTLFCAQCESDHVRALIRPVLASPKGHLADQTDKDAGRTVLISVEGLGIVGAVKQIGDATFLALQDVRNSRGKLTLVKGGLYDINVDLLNLELRHLRRLSDRFTVLKVKTLKVRPERFFNPSHMSVSPYLNSWNLSERQLEFRKLLQTVLENLEAKAKLTSSNH